MVRFARVFDTEKTQVLFYYEYEPDDEQTVFHQILDFEAGRVDLAIRFDGDIIEKVAARLANLTQSDADKLVSDMSNFFNSLETKEE